MGEEEGGKEGEGSRKEVYWCSYFQKRGRILCWESLMLNNAFKQHKLERVNTINFNAHKEAVASELPTLINVKSCTQET